MSRAIREYYLAILAFISVLFIFGLGWSYAYSVLYPAVTFSGINELHPPIASPGQTVTLYREFTVNRPVVIHVYRALTRKLDNKKILRVEFGETSISRETENIVQYRPLVIPHEMPSGIYVFETAIEYWSFPFWRVQTRAPDVVIEIVAPVSSSADKRH